MTELQIGLIGLGAVAVSGVVVYNTWQEYRHRKMAQGLLEPAQDDVLLDQPHDGDDASAGDVPPIRAAAEATSEWTAADAMQVDADDIARDEPTMPATRDMHNVAEPMLSGDRLSPRPVPTSRQAPAADARIEPVLHLEQAIEAAPRLDAFLPDTPAEPATASVELPDPVVERPPIPPAPVEPTVPPVSPPPVKARPTVPEPVAHGSDLSGDDFREVAEPQHLLSADIDYIAAFEAVEPASAAQILGASQRALARVRKPIHWFGYNEVMREWEAIEASSTVEYRSLRVGLQLVDRQGPVAEGDLTVFHVAMHDLAHTLMAIVDMPHRQTVLEAAVALDGFCAGVDIQIGINVISTASLFPGTKIRALAEAAGMVVDGGRFVRADDDGNVLYVLLNQEDVAFSGDTMKTLTTHGLTFLLDVPTVAHGDRIFNQMVDLAKRFAEVLKGALVDDNRRPLPDGALEPIRRQIAQYQASMAARKLAAGGRLAKRLFS